MMVIVKNNTSYFLYVDVTYYDDVDYYNDERLLGLGQSTSYVMKAEHLIIWAANSTDRANNNWKYSDVYLDVCENYTYTWKSLSKGNVEIVVDNNIFQNYDELKGVPK